MVRGTAGVAAAEISKLGDLAAEAGLHRVTMLAWRDLDDPEAGGSEVHASTVASLWAEAGIEVTMRTSFASGQPQMSWRDGYRVIRKAGRYMVFPRAAFSEMMGWHGGSDGLVEIWNGMPFFSPVWARSPHITFLHHVHAEMWDMTLPPHLARMGRTLESRIAPPFYRRTPTVTLSQSSKQELVEDLGFKEHLVHVVPPGIDPRFSPGGELSPTPLVVAVGSARPGEALRAADRGARGTEALAPAARGSDRGGGLPARPARAADPRGRGRAVDPPARTPERPGAARPVPAGPGCSRAPRRARVGG